MEKTNSRNWLKAIPIDIEGLYEQVNESLPHSAKRWWWCWGGIVGLLFGLQAITGLLLAVYYRAEPTTAYQSVAFITEHARFGNFLRSLHQWGATFMVVFLYLHMLRVFFTGAFRGFRWGAWMAGVVLFGLTLGLGFTGYSLVYEQLSYWAITVTSNIISYIPIVGPNLKNFFLAGNDINSATLSRMYALHVQILPAGLMLFVLVHIFFIRLFGMHKPGSKADEEAEEKEVREKGAYHFYPDHMVSEIAVFLFLFLVIALLALAIPAQMGPPSDPTMTPEHIKPEWYFYAQFHLLKLIPGQMGVVMMGLLGVLLFFWPIFDHYIFQKIDKAVFKNRFELSALLGVVVLGFYLAWSIIEASF